MAQENKTVVSIILKAIDETKSGFTTPLRNISDMEKSLAKIAPAAKVAGGAIVAALAAMTKIAIDSADAFEQISQKSGFTAAQISKMAYSAKLADTDIGSLSSTSKFLNKNLVEAATDGSSDAARAFTAMGINIRAASGEIKTSGQIIDEVAIKFASYEKGAEKSTLALQLFGKSGTENIAFLNQYGDDLRSGALDTKGFSDATARQADEFNDGLVKMSSTAGEFSRTLATELLPHLLQIVEAMNSASSVSKTLNEAASGLAQYLRGLSLVVSALVLGFQTAATIIGGAFILAIDAAGAVVLAIADAFIEWAKSIGDIAFSLWELIKITGEFAKVWGDVLTGQFVKAAIDSKSAIENIGEEVTKLGGKFVAMGENVSGAVKKDLKAGWDQAGIDSKIAIDKMIADYERFISISDSLMFGPPIKGPEAAKEKAPVVQKKQEDALDKTGEQLQNVINLRNKLTTDSLTGLDAEIAKEFERYSKSVQQIQKQVDESHEYYELLDMASANYFKRVAELTAEAEQRRTEAEAKSIEAAQSFNSQRLQEEMKLQEEFAVLQNDRYAASQAHFDLEREMENQRYEEKILQIGQLRLTEEESLAALESAQKNHSSRMLLLKKKEEASKLQIHLAYTDLTADAFGNLATVAQAFGRKGFAAYKAFASAQAIIATYSSAVKAYDSLAGIPFVGPALGAAAAAAAIAAGLMNVGRINSAQPPSAHAGLDFVPEQSTYVLQRGERILAPNQNAEMMEFMRSQSRPQSGGEINLHIGGERIATLLYSMSRDGQLKISQRALLAA